MPIQTERWFRLDPVGLAVKQRIVPGINGILTTDLAAAIPHQWRRVGVADADAATLQSLQANEGQSSVVTTQDTLRYGSYDMWLVRTNFPNPQNLYNASDSTTQITEYEQIWQESPQNPLGT